MCLIALAYKVHPRFPMIMAANRDEFQERPTAPAQWWHDAPHVLGGRDLQAGGTWMGITRSGRFAALTNHRDLHRMPTPLQQGSPRQQGPSRGLLVRNALNGALDVRNTAAYEGFNLLYGTVNALRYHNNVEPADAPLAPGVHGLSNAFLNTPWPKVERAKAGMEQLLNTSDDALVDALFALLHDAVPAHDSQLPDTGLPLPMERAVSPIFISTDGYGTRCSTVVLVDAEGHVYFEERTVGGGKVVEVFRPG